MREEENKESSVPFFSFLLLLSPPFSRECWKAKNTAATCTATTKSQQRNAECFRLCAAEDEKKKGASQKQHRAPPLRLACYLRYILRFRRLILWDALKLVTTRGLTEQRNCSLRNSWLLWRDRVCWRMKVETVLFFFFCGCVFGKKGRKVFSSHLLIPNLFVAVRKHCPGLVFPLSRLASSVGLHPLTVRVRESCDG